MRKIWLGILKKLKFLPPEIYVKFYYEYYMGKKLNLKNPLVFNEKIQWIKAFNRPKTLNQLVDKLVVRAYVKRKIGASYLNELLLVGNKPGDIDFEKLTNKFVVKATHGCNFNLIVNDKAETNIIRAKLLFRKWLSKNQYYRGGLERAYKDVPPRLIVEKFMAEEGKSALTDYKFYYFDGKPIYVQVDVKRGKNHTRSFYDINWPISFRLPGSIYII